MRRVCEKFNAREARQSWNNLKEEKQVWRSENKTQESKWSFHILAEFTLR